MKPESHKTGKQEEGRKQDKQDEVGGVVTYLDGQSPTLRIAHDSPALLRTARWSVDNPAIRRKAQEGRGAR